MHELARCVLALRPGVRVAGYVESFVADRLQVRLPEPVTGLECGAVVELRVLDEVRGEVHYAGLVDDVTDTVVSLSDVERLAVRQRRGAARVRVNTPCTGVVGHTSGPPTDVRLTVLDISATGVRLLSPQPLALDTVVTFPFIADDVELQLTARVVWVEESISGWRHGCRLDGSSPRDIELLFRFVLLTQGRQRRQAMDRFAAGP